MTLGHSMHLFCPSHIHSVTGVTIFLLWPEAQQYSFVQKISRKKSFTFTVLDIKTSSLIKELLLCNIADLLSVFCMSICLLTV